MKKELIKEYEDKIKQFKCEKEMFDEFIAFTQYKIKGLGKKS